MIPRSGRQYDLRSGRYRVTVASVGATLRMLRYDGRDLVRSFDADVLRPGMSGAVLAPWPNRTSDGRYEFDGAVHQLAINEIDRRTAAHGLVAWTGFEPERVEDDAVLLSTTIEPQEGYPWRVRIDAEFTLTEAGLRQSVTATNLGAERAPVALGAHPYLLAGAARKAAIDEWRLALTATRMLTVSEDRCLPVRPASAGIDGSELPLRGRTLNNAFTGLEGVDAGRPIVRVVDATGQGAELVLGDGAGWVQLYTSDESIGDEFRSAVAVEPQTSPPDALNSGLDLPVIGPGESVHLSWGIRAVQRPGIRA
ncbi:aldose 1-epimerase family protein [Microbacterium sp. NPDC057650]|uniref:aldose 1-epimerase family protein n=1 Tax=unclassified Microbacterium TaxID=2609290 RepID=UPI00367013D2